MSTLESAATLAPLTCSVCRRSSSLREAFIIGKDGTAPRTWCPVCAAKHRDRISSITEVLTVAMIALALPFLLAAHPPRAMAYSFAYAIFMLSLSLTILPHELGHALAGRWLGFRPLCIEVGSGRRLVDRDVAGVRLRIGRHPRGGATLLDLQEDPHFNRRMMAILAAGPAVNILLAALAFNAAASIGGFWLDVPGKLALTMFALANTYVAIGSFWPHEVNSPAGRVASDGAQIWKHFRGAKPDISRVRPALQLLRASYAYVDEDFAAAERAAAVAAQMSSDSKLIAAALVFRAAALCEGGQPLAAAAALREVLAREDLDDATRAEAQHGLAWACLLLDEPGALAEGLALSACSLAALPWNQVVIIKRACLTAATATPAGIDTSEPRRLLASLRDFTLDRQSNAYAALARGLLAAAEGDSRAARVEYERARALRATAAPLRVLERRLASN